MKLSRGEETKAEIENFSFYNIDVLLSKLSCFPDQVLQLAILKTSLKKNTTESNKHEFLLGGY